MWQIETSNWDGPAGKVIAREGINFPGTHVSQWWIKWLPQALPTTIQTGTMTKKTKILGVQNIPGAERIQSWAKQKQTTKQSQHHHAVISVARLAMYIWNIAPNLQEKPRASRRCVDFTGSRTKAQTCLACLYWCGHLCWRQSQTSLNHG